MAHGHGGHFGGFLGSGHVAQGSQQEAVPLWHMPIVLISPSPPLCRSPLNPGKCQLSGRGVWTEPRKTPPCTDTPPHTLIFDGSGGKPSHI